MFMWSWGPPIRGLQTWLAGLFAQTAPIHLPYRMYIYIYPYENARAASYSVAFETRLIAFGSKSQTRTCPGVGLQALCFPHGFGGRSCDCTARAFRLQCAWRFLSHRALQKPQQFGHGARDHVPD